MHKQRFYKGFTLIEVLIALLVLSIIATMGVIGLQAIINTNERQEVIANEFAELQFAYLIIKRDVSQVITRYITDASNEQRPAFIGTTNGTSSIPMDISMNGNILMELTRGGVANPQQLMDRSHLQRVTYTFDKAGTLQRYAWFALDRMPRSPYVLHTVLKNINELHLTYFDRFGQRLAQWNTKVPNTPSWLTNLPQSDVLPAAMEWRFQHKRYGEIIWLFLMPGANNAETIT